MRLNIPLEALRRFLNDDPDCEALSENEYVADLYDAETPLTVDILLNKDSAEIAAAAALVYDNIQDGWYMGEQTEDEALITRVFERAMSGANNA